MGHFLKTSIFALLVTLTIVTDAANHLNRTTLSSKSLLFKSIGSSKSITIMSNENWTVTSNKKWIAVTPGFGYGDGSIDIHVLSNMTYSDREGTLTLVTGSSSQTIVVYQNRIEDYSPDRPSDNGNVVIYKPYVSPGVSYTVSLEGVDGSQNITSAIKKAPACSSQPDGSFVKFTNIPFGIYRVTVLTNYGQYPSHKKPISDNITVASPCTTVNIDTQLKKPRL